MADTYTISAEAFDRELQHMLQNYGTAQTEALDRAAEKAMANLLRLSKAAAPVGARAEGDGSPHYFQSIATRKAASSLYGSSYLWYVRKPHHPLTHLLAKPHASRSGSVVAPSFDLAGVLDEVLADYTESVRRLFS